MKKSVLFAAVALILAACSSEEPTSLPNKSNETVGHNPYRVTLNDALKTADMLLDDIAGDAQTRSGKQRRVASVEYMTNPGTRASGSDTLLYLVNYADDAGFALLSADKRLRPVYAISDEGSLSFADTTYNKGLALFAQGVEADISGIPSGSFPIDTTINKPLTPDFGGTYIKSKVTPLLTPSVREWGQGDPYNNRCIINGNQYAYAGCAAVAVGQIMSYYSYPNTFGNIYFNWTLMKNGMDYDGVALLLRLLGDEENLDMEYHLYGGDEGCGASPNRIRPTFINMGYDNPGDLKDFSSTSIKSYLDKTLTTELGGGPVLVCGYGTNSNGKRVGHAWVIDGYIQYESKGSLVPGGYLLHDVLFHCVWGWNGDSNGYFYWDKANQFGGDPIEKEEDDDSYNLEDPLFDDDVKFMGGFVPNNQ